MAVTFDILVKLLLTSHLSAKNSRVLSQMEMRKFADYILEAFFSFKIVGQDLFTCGLLIKSNWTLAILLFLFLGLPVFCTVAWVVAGGLHSRLFFCLMPVHQGGQTFLTCWLCRDLQMKALASSSASKAAVLSR